MTGAKMTKKTAKMRYIKIFLKIFWPKLVKTLAFIAILIVIAPNAFAKLSVKYNKGETRFSWKGKAEALIISQGDLQKEYVFEEPPTSFIPPPEDFADFTEGPAVWSVLQNSTKKEQRINLTTQYFRQVLTDGIKIKSLPQVLQKPGMFKFKAKALVPIEKIAYLVRPDGDVDIIYFSENDIAAGENFSINIKLEKEGTYIFEVNDMTGLAVVNVPIFVGKSTPLLPDPFPLVQVIHPDPAPIENLAKTRKYMLKLINKFRVDLNLNPLKLNAALTKIAQAHTDNMVEQEFLGHTDIEELEPWDRAQKANYPAYSSVEEILTKITTPENVIAGFMRSPSHRSAILNPQNKVAGIGLAKDGDGWLYATIDFSAAPR